MAPDCHQSGRAFRSRFLNSAVRPVGVTDRKCAAYQAGSDYHARPEDVKDFGLSTPSTIAYLEQMGREDHISLRVETTPRPRANIGRNSGRPAGNGLSSIQS